MMAESMIRPRLLEKRTQSALRIDNVKETKSK